MGKFSISDSTEGDCIITDPPSDCVITSTLDIYDAVPNDSGEYVCTAINAAGSNTTSVSLTVHGKSSLHKLTGLFQILLTFDLLLIVHMLNVYIMSY